MLDIYTYLYRTCNYRPFSAAPARRRPSEELASDARHPPEEVESRGWVTGGPGKFGPVAQAQGVEGGITPERTSADRLGPLVERLGPFVGAHGVIEPSEVVQP